MMTDDSEQAVVRRLGLSAEIVAAGDGTMAFRVCVVIPGIAKLTLSPAEAIDVALLLERRARSCTSLEVQRRSRPERSLTAKRESQEHV